MNSEADFVAAIAASPGDELLFRAFADWLEERGDARAAWVRSPHVRAWMGEKFDGPIPALIAALKAKSRVMEVRRAMPGVGAPIVPELLPLLKDQDSYVRLQAVWCVRKIGKAAADAVPALLELLKDPDHQVREQATKALAVIGPSQGSDTTNLREVVSDRGNYLRHDAAGILGRMGAKDAVTDELIAQLATGDAAAREAAVEGLRFLGRSAAVGPLCRALSDPEPQVRAAAAAAFSHSAFASAQAVGPLRAALADPVSGIRHRAASALGSLGHLAAEAVDDLLALLRNDDAVRSNAAIALGGIAAGDERVLEALVAATADKDLETARHVAYALKHWPSLPARTTDALLALARRLERAGRCPVLPAMGKLERPSRALLTLLRRVVRRPEGPGTEFAYASEAAELLGRFGPAAAESIPDLVTAARIGNYSSARALARMGQAGVEALVGMLEEDDRARDVAIRGLGAAGEAAAAALPWLRRRVSESEDVDTRRSAIGVFRAIGPPAIADLLGLLGDNPWVADDAREALQAFGGGALMGHLPALAAVLRDRTASAATKLRATRLLVEVAAFTREAAGPLREALRLGAEGGAEAAQMRRYAVEGLGKVADADVLPDVLPLLSDPDDNVRREAAVALGKVKSNEAVPGLVRALRDPAEGVRARAAEALGKLRAKGESVVEALRRAEKDADKAVRREAAAALRKIEGKRQG